MAWSSWRWRDLYLGKTCNNMKTYFFLVVYLTLINSFVCVSSGDVGSDDKAFVSASDSSSIVFGRRRLLSSLDDTVDSIVHSGVKRRDSDSPNLPNKPITSHVPPVASAVVAPTPESKSVAAAAVPENSKSKNSTAELKASGDSQSSIDPSGDSDEEFSIGPKGLSPDAVLRLFYVFVAVGIIILIYILIKLLRLRRRRAARKYRVVSHGDDQEMFPLAADDGDDEEIYNAADHQTQK